MILLVVTPTIFPNQDLCKEELSLLQRGSLNLLLKPTDNEHKKSISSISGKKHYDDEVELNLLKKDIQSLKLESKIAQRNNGYLKEIEQDIYGMK